MSGFVSGKIPCPKLNIYDPSANISKYFFASFLIFSLSASNILGLKPPCTQISISLLILLGSIS